jgi:hypothetical protein
VVEGGRCLGFDEVGMTEPRECRGVPFSVLHTQTVLSDEPVAIVSPSSPTNTTHLRMRVLKRT